MYWHTVKEEKGKKVTANETTSIELPDTGLITGIELRMSMKNAAGIANVDNPDLIDHITKIEVVANGDDIRYSLSGREAKAMAYWNDGVIPPRRHTNFPNETTRECIFIEFGRYWEDSEFLFDLGKFDSVELQVTNDLTDSYCDVDNITMDVYLRYAEDVATVPANYFKTYEFKSETPDKDED